MHALSSFLVHRFVLFCILAYKFVVCIKSLDLYWQLSNWGYGLIPLSCMVISAMASSMYLWSC